MNEPVMLVLLADIDLVRGAEAEHLAIKAERLLELRRVHDEMAKPLDVRRAALNAFVIERVAPLGLVLAEIDLRPVERDFRQHRHAVDDLDLEPVGVGQAHAPAAAGLVDVLDLRGAVDARQFVEVFEAAGVEGDADVFRVAQFGHVEVVRRVGAAHVERILGAVGAHHAERGEEFLLLVEIGRAQPPISEIGDFDDGHGNLPEGNWPQIGMRPLLRMLPRSGAASKKIDINAKLASVVELPNLLSCSSGMSGVGDIVDGRRARGPIVAAVLGKGDTAPACPETPPPATVARMSNLSVVSVEHGGGCQVGPQRLGGEERLERPMVDADGPGPGAEKHAGGCGLPPARCVMSLLPRYATSSLEGFCAACG